MNHRWVCIGKIAFAPGGIHAWSKEAIEDRGSVADVIEWSGRQGAFVQFTLSEKEVAILVRDFRASVSQVWFDVVEALCEAAAAHGGKGTVYAASHALAPGELAALKSLPWLAGLGGVLAGLPDDEGELRTWKIKEGTSVVAQKFVKPGKLGKAADRFEPAEQAFLKWLEQDGDARFRATNSGLYGFIDTKGRFAIEPRFTRADSFSGGRAPVRIPGEAGPRGPMRVIDASGVLRGEPIFSTMEQFRDGRAAVHGYDEQRTGQAAGYIDEEARVVVPMKYTKAHPFSCGVGRIQGGAGERFVNRSGEFIVDRSFSWASDFSNGVGLAWQANTWFAFDATGALLFESKDESILPFCDGLAPVKRGGLWGFIDKSGRAVIEPRFEEARPFNGDRAAVKANDKLRFIDRSGAFHGDAFRWSHEVVTEGRMPIYEIIKDIRVGFLSDDGVLVIPHRFGAARAFQEGMSAVQIDTQWGFIDREGQTVIAPAFDDAQSFVNGFACVKKGGLWGYVNRAGAFVIAPAFASASPFADGLAAVQLP